MVTGKVLAVGSATEHQFQCRVFCLSDGRWGLYEDELKFYPTFPCFFNLLYNSDALQNLENLRLKIVGAFGVTAMQGIPAEEGGFRVRLHQIFADSKVIKDAFGVVRSNIISIYRPSWQSLWEVITNRAEFDPQFVVDGYSKGEALAALQNLARLLPADWIKSKYASAAQVEASRVNIWQDIDQGSECWFPVAQLVRIANGFLCKDEHLNALVSLGLQAESLRSMPGGNRMLERVGKLGFFFQALLAARFIRLGLLRDVERQHGNTQDDLVVEATNLELGVEVKTVSENKLSAQWLQAIILDKTKKLPKRPARPVLLAVFPIPGAPTAESLASAAPGNRSKQLYEIIREINPDRFDWGQKVKGILVLTVHVDSGCGEPFIVLESAWWPRDACALQMAAVTRLFQESRARGLVPSRMPYGCNYVLPKGPEPLSQSDENTEPTIGIGMQGG